MDGLPKGIVQVSRNRVVLKVCEDFSKFQRELIYWEFPNLIGGLALPRHGSHVTIASSKFAIIDQERADKWHGAPVSFTYGPIYIGGFKAGFVGFYMKIFSGLLDIIKNDVIVSETGDSSFHLSICNSKALNVCQTIQKETIP